MTRSTFDLYTRAVDVVLTARKQDEELNTFASKHFHADTCNYDNSDNAESLLTCVLELLGCDHELANWFVDFGLGLIATRIKNQIDWDEHPILRTDVDHGICIQDYTDFYNFICGREVKTFTIQENDRKANWNPINETLQGIEEY